MKCSACNEKLCEGKYQNREECLGRKEEIDCSCICQMKKNEVNMINAASISAGIAVAAAGVGLSLATGGIVTLISGAAIVGAGSSLVFTPIQKYVSNDRVTIQNLIEEAALGATIGAVTGPIGAAGSAATKGVPIALKFGIRAAAGSTAGVVSGAISEGARFAKGEKVTLDSVVKSMTIGAVVKSFGGASSELASTLSHGVANEVGQAATRIAIQSGSAAATDAGIQLYQNKSIDPQQLLLNTTGQVTISTTTEFSTSVVHRTNNNSHNVDSKIYKMETGKINAMQILIEKLKGNFIIINNMKNFENSEFKAAMNRKFNEIMKFGHLNKNIPTSNGNIDDYIDNDYDDNDKMNLVNQ